MSRYETAKAIAMKFAIMSNLDINWLNKSYYYSEYLSLIVARDCGNPPDTYGEWADCTKDVLKTLHDRFVYEARCKIARCLGQELMPSMADVGNWLSPVCDNRILHETTLAYIEQHNHD